MKNIVYQVTWQHMKMNKRRSWTAFFGIFFMVLLVTCVFVGRETAIGYLQDVGTQKKGKWHVSIYEMGADVKDAEKLREIQSLDYIEESGKSADYGYTKLPGAGGKGMPYLYVKAYEKPCFDWMNLKLKKGRLPESSGEAVISQSVADAGEELQVGDVINADYFDRTITGLKKGVTTTFPFFDVEVSAGETFTLPQDFPYYEKNESFRIDKKYTGESDKLKIVGIVETPWFEQEGAAGGYAFTCFEEDRADVFNVSFTVDLKKVPDSIYEEIKGIVGDKRIDFNDNVLSFAGSSSDSVVNFIVQVMTVFFMTVIVLAAVILIYNVFNMSFEERSRYLGMLCSVGATGRQKRSSVYFEAFILFLPALPLGILAGCVVVWLGISAFQPFIYAIIPGYATVVERVPVHLIISWKELLFVAAGSGVTVLVSSILPARKISKVGPIECIRGNLEKGHTGHGKSAGYHPGIRVERMLAEKSLRHQRRKTRSMNRAASVFMLILIVTTASAQMVTTLVGYRMVDSEIAVRNNFEKWDYELTAFNGNSEEYQKLKKEIESDDGVEKVCEEYSGMFAGNIPNDALSREYWNALHRIFNLYYHRELSEEEFQKNFESGASVVSLIAVDSETFGAIAEASDTDMDLLKKKDAPAAIVVQSGEVSTENWSVEGMTPEKYEFRQIEKMTDMKKGENLPMTIYSPADDIQVDFPLCIAGFASNEQLKNYFTFHSETMWVIVELETGDKINEIFHNSENSGEGYDMLTKSLHLRMNGRDTKLIKKLTMLSETDEDAFGFAPADYTRTYADAIESIIWLMLASFTVLTSVICLLNLYNSVHGWIADQKPYFAMMASIGMTRGQIRRMLVYEAAHILLRSCVWAVFLSAALTEGIKKCIIERFGYVRISFPWEIYLAAIFTGAIVIFGFMLYHYHKEKDYDLRTVLMV